MKKKLMPTFSAFIILILLLVYANYYEVEEILPPGAQRPEPILNCSMEEITQITWKRPNTDEVKLEIASNSSRVIASGSFLGDKNETDGIRQHFAELRYEMVVAENATDTSAFGLSDESPVVVINTATQSWELSLGNKIEIGGSYYLSKKDDNRVFMVPGYISGDFNKKSEDLRSRQWFTDNFGQASNVSIKRKNKTIEMHISNEHNEWLISKPVQLAADGLAVAELIEKLRTLSIYKFVNDTPPENEDYGFDDDATQIIVINKEGKKFAIEIGKKSGIETYIRIAGTKPVHVSLSSDMEIFERDVNDFRDKYLAPPKFDNINEVTVSDASGTIVIENKNNKWHIGVQIVEKEDVKALINAIGQSRINEFRKLENLEDHGLDDEENCRHVEIKAGDKTFLTWLGNREGANLSIKNQSELMIISADLDNAFSLFMNRIRNPIKVKKQ